MVGALKSKLAGKPAMLLQTIICRRPIILRAAVTARPRSMRPQLTS
jgi:hypothetical protein